MKKLFSLLIFFIAFSINAQIITNVDKLRINEITEMQEAGKILVIDSNNLVQWVSEDKITPDLSDYYTKIDVDAILEDYYDKGEVDALLSDIDLSDYYTKTEVDGRFALRSRSITGTGGLTGGGDLTANRTLDLSSSTKSDIAKGVIANGWGDFRDYGLGVNDSEVTNDSHNDLRTGFYTSNTGTQNLPAGVSGNAFILAMKPREDRAHRLMAAMGRDRIFWQRYFNGWQDPVEFWHSGNFDPSQYATETWVNNQGFISDLSDYYTKTEVDDLLSNLPSGTPNLADVLGEGNSANNMKITDLADGVDAGDAVNKSQLDALESPFEVVDVTQQAYSDIAIVVKDFDNIANGMTYQEGAIDFGVSRNIIHQMGLYSFKAGLETTSSGTASSAFGGQTIASGFASSAFGDSTTASGDYSSAFGQFTEASGDCSSSFGTGTTASGDYSSAFGDSTTASGSYSSSFGDNTTASGDYSSAFGHVTEASGSYSSSFGDNTTASGDYSSAFGLGSQSNEYASLAIGMYSTDGTAETSWVDGSPIFKVGNGTFENNRKNAYTLYNDGRSEQEKDMEVTTIGQGFVMKSPDGTRWRITVDNSGTLSAEQL